MKKTLIFAFVLISIFANAQTNSITLSDSAQVSLLTCEAGKPIYARWGHSAIRILDEKNQLDLAYNYGIFDYSDVLTFTLKFVSGATDYQLAVWSFESFMDEYNERKSSVYEQVLDLTQEEKQQLFDTLQENYLPENRIYRYNFVYDNCATRPFDKIMNVLRYMPIIAYSHPTTTYRAIFEQFIGLNNWNRFGVDLLIGRDADKRVVDTYALRAFPSYTAAIVGSITLDNSKSLVSETRKISDFPLLLPIEKGVFSPNIVCSFILILLTALSLWGWKNRKELILLDFALFFVSGAIGVVIFYLMCFSTHPLVHQNFNLLWLNPLQFVFAFLLLKKSWRKTLSYYALFNTFTTLLAIIVLVTRFQTMPPAFLPLMALFLMRSILFFQNNKII